MTTTFQMKAIRFRSDEGVRNGVLVGEGPKWLKLILPDCRGIRVTEVPQADRQFISEIDVPIAKALTTLKVHAARVGCLQSAADVLGIRPIDPPRDEDPNCPTPSQMRQEFEAMARSANIKKAQKATDKKPRAKREPKVKDETSNDAAKAAAVSFMSSKKIGVAELEDRDTAARVRAVMAKAAPDRTGKQISMTLFLLKQSMKKAAA